VPKRHPPETRAAAVAAVATGGILSEVARRYGISKGRLSDWCASDIQSAADLDRAVPERSGTAGGVVRGLQRRTIAGLAHELVCTSLETLTVQARVAGAVPWIEKQSARGLAEYRGVELDRLLRLLPAFSPDEETERDGDIVDLDVVDASARLGEGERDDRPAD
jgi:transposase-like protein